MEYNCTKNIYRTLMVDLRMSMSFKGRNVTVYMQTSTDKCSQTCSKKGNNGARVDSIISK